MKILNGEARKLLVELIENQDSDIAKILANKFKGLSYNQDTRLRGIISYLISEGYLEIPQNGWADDVPFIAMLTYQGENYLHFEVEEKRKKIQKTNEIIIQKPDNRQLKDMKEAEDLDKKKVFVVHGRNEKIRKSMFDFLHSIGLKPIEWDEAKRMTGKPTPYIGEVLDKVFLNAQAVIVLMTPDDEAKLKLDFIQANDQEYEKSLTPQARPNVLYEAGMAMGRCPERTILVEFGDNLRPYSDIGGLNVIRMIDTPEKRNSLIAALKTAGADVDDLTGKIHWLSTGDFNLDLEKRVTQHENSSNIKKNMIYNQNGFYTLSQEDGSKKIICSQCWDANEKQINLHITEDARYYCPNCKTNGYIDVEAHKRYIERYTNSSSGIRIEPF